MNRYTLVAAASLAGVIASVDVASAMPVAASSPDNTVIHNADWHHHDYRYHNYRDYRYRNYHGYRDGYYPRYGYYHHHHGPIGRLLHHL
ncbi:hypothetical protein GCM10007874_15870 [Labrys miyagiensis]|uniref:BA14K family protein n=1 Tax=Labrys miyagiensis TaxID=346912 RepID=A0ABQ6CF74_9HYPH|nr:hypothetical protein GCM10007874_15870 [Labrys miyagiensis]